MKSLILKDLYNIGHNVKSLAFSVLILACGFIPTGNGQECVYISTTIFTMMIITTFNFDENCKWNHYAMVMPVSKKDIVASKYVVMLIFAAAGAAAGILVDIVGALLTKSADINKETMLANAAAAFFVGIVFGSMAIPLVLRFGTEKSRLLMFVSFLVPSALIFGICKLLSIAGVEFTDALIIRLLCFSPLLAAVWLYAMFRISCAVFERREI